MKNLTPILCIIVLALLAGCGSESQQSGPSSAPTPDTGTVQPPAATEKPSVAPVATTAVSPTEIPSSTPPATPSAAAAVTTAATMKAMATTATQSKAASSTVTKTAVDEIQARTSTLVEKYKGVGSKPDVSAEDVTQLRNGTKELFSYYDQPGVLNTSQREVVGGAQEKMLDLLDEAASANDAASRKNQVMAVERAMEGMRAELASKSVPK